MISELPEEKQGTNTQDIKNGSGGLDETATDDYGENGVWVEREYTVDGCMNDYGENGV